MFWFLLCLIVGSTIVFGYLAWRKWIAPWREIEDLIPAGRPNQAAAHLSRRWRTCAASGWHRAGRNFSAPAETRPANRGARIGNRNNSRRHAGWFARGRCRAAASLLANRTFQRLFSLREISLGAPLLDTVRDTTLDQMIAETLNTGESTRREISTWDRNLKSTPCR